ncbi:MAG TPA: lysozyme [Novosphingobium sp.]|nr:lysozyme [Novosphingobium sp.]HZV10851.1 lysozyme [Novosphingobium sp.]
MSLAIGPAGIALIQAFEQCGRALPGGRFAAYPDPASRAAPWTIGWGSTGPGITRATVWTRAQCDARLVADLARFSARVAGLLAPAPTSQHQFDALVSLAYNLGAERLQASRLLALHRAGDHAGAARAFARWASANGQPMPGLIRRRAAEAALYATPDGQRAPPIPQ